MKLNLNMINSEDEIFQIGYMLNITLRKESISLDQIWHKNLSSKGILLICFRSDQILSDRKRIAYLVIILFTFFQ